MDEKEELLLEQLLSQFDHTDHMKDEDIPKIPLYMDQLLTFMEDFLSKEKRHEEDKALTKTMINNYAKNKVLPAPEKKKYTSEHIITLLFIYYMKNFLSISDIQTLLEPVLEQSFGKSGAGSMKDLYQHFVTMCEEEMQPLVEDITRKVSLSGEGLENVPEEQRETFRRFALITLLSFDVYEKKRMIESIIDDYFIPLNEEKENKAKEPKPKPGKAKVEKARKVSKKRNEEEN